MTITRHCPVCDQDIPYTMAHICTLPSATRMKIRPRSQTKEVLEKILKDLKIWEFVASMNPHGRCDVLNYQELRKKLQKLVDEI